MMKNFLMAAVAAVTLGMTGAAMASTPILNHATSGALARNEQVAPQQRPAYLARNEHGPVTHNYDYLARNDTVLPSQRPAYLARNEQVAPQQRPAYLARNDNVLPSQRPAYLARNEQVAPQQRPAYLA
jgi:hypothetical protein